MDNRFCESSAKKCLMNRLSFPHCFPICWYLDSTWAKMGNSHAFFAQLFFLSFCVVQKKTVLKREGKQNTTTFAKIAMDLKRAHHCGAKRFSQKNGGWHRASISLLPTMTDLLVILKPNYGEKGKKNCCHWDFQAPPRTWDPLPILFPYHSHKNP